MYIIIAIFGLIFGSFITMLVYRMPIGEDIVFLRSRCTKCNYKLSVVDLMPVISWVVNKGKCRKCNANIGLTYLLIEIITPAIFLINYYKYSLSTNFFILCAVSICLIAIIFIDINHYIIPDELQIILLILSLIYAYINNYKMNDVFINIISIIFISVTAKAIITKIKKQESLGFGDIKFLVISSIFITTVQIPIFLLISGLLGILTGILWQIFFDKKIFPFAPSLAISLFLCLLLKVEDIFYFATLVIG